MDGQLELAGRRVSRSWLTHEVLSARALLDECVRLFEAQGVRPVCLCVPNGVPLYLSRIGAEARVILKRMPGSGPFHHSDCPASYVQDVPSEDDRVRLSPAFRLNLAEAARGAPRTVAPPGTSTIAPGAGKTPLTGLLAFLWESGEVSCWYPGMRGKRSYAVVRRCLLGAAARARLGDIPLEELLYVPAAFSEELPWANYEELEGQVKRSAAAGNLTVVVGELKVSRVFGRDAVLTLRHLPQARFRVKAKDIGGMTPVDFVSAKEHRLAIAMTVARAAQEFVVHEVGWLRLGPQWLPARTHEQHQLVHELVESARYFQVQPGASFAVRLLDVTGGALDVRIGSMPAGYKIGAERVWWWDPRKPALPLPPGAQRARASGVKAS